MTVKEFYRSIAWVNCRKAYRKKAGGLCERCLQKGLYSVGTEVHHKTRLTNQNVNDESVSLNFDNLELLCEKCHHDEHRFKGTHRNKRRFRIDLQTGEVDSPQVETTQGI